MAGTNPPTGGTWRQVLIPVRGGPDAAARVQLALDLAAGVGAAATVLYVIDERVLGDPDAGLVREQLDAQLQREGEAMLASVAQLAAGRPVPLAQRIERGPVVETILRVAADIGADVIVVGSHRQTWLGRLLGRSLAESVLQSARCAVLAVPPAHER
jgi:nucleotide-binding universal stress UspA family protein